MNRDEAVHHVLVLGGLAFVVEERGDISPNLLAASREAVGALLRHFEIEVAERPEKPLPMSEAPRKPRADKGKKKVEGSIEISGAMVSNQSIIEVEKVISSVGSWLSAADIAAVTPYSQSVVRRCLIHLINQDKVQRRIGDKGRFFYKRTAS